MKSFTDQAGANIANSVGTKHGINSQQLAGVVSNLLLNGSLGLGGEEKLGKGGGGGLAQKVMDSLGIKAGGKLDQGSRKVILGMKVS